METKKSHVQIKGISYYMDGYLKQNLDNIIKAVEKKWDGIILVDGMEGSGKSTFTMSLSYYVSNGNFTINDIFYSPEQFEKWVDESKDSATGMWDEFVLGGLSEEALTRMQIAIIKKMTLIRKKRLKIFLLIPYIFMLRPYFAIARPRCLIHIYSPDGITRGYFSFYNYSQKRELYFKNKKTWNYKNIHPSFRGRFTDYENMFINRKEYETKKDEAIKITQKDSTQAWKDKVLSAVSNMWNFAKETYPEAITQKNLSDWFEVSDRQIRRWISGRTD